MHIQFFIILFDFSLTWEWSFRSQTYDVMTLFDILGGRWRWCNHAGVLILLKLLQVFPFGSVPLKTYLPDGDIDLTAFGGMNVEEALANDVCAVLEREDQNMAAEFMVKDVQLIRAEVLAFTP